MQVVDEAGRPLADAAVALTTDPTGLPATFERAGIGHPRALRPQWVARTDASGQATLDELPPAQLFLTVQHATYAPSTQLGANFRIRVEPGSRVTVVMRELVGVAFVCPSRAAIRHLSWSLPLRAIDRSPAVLRTLPTAVDVLHDRFPDALVYAHALKAGLDGQIGLRVALEDDTFWAGEWELRPIREVTEPVFLEQDLDVAYREMTLELVDAAGRQLDGYRLIAVHEDLGLKIACSAGSPELLPHGSWTLRPEPCPAWMFPDFGLRGHAFEVSDQGPPRVRVELSRACARLRIEPRFEGELLAPVHVRVDDERQEGIMIANWRPSRGPILCEMPIGRIEIETTSAGYETIHEFVDLESSDEDTVVELQLVPRPPRGK